MHEKNVMFCYSSWQIVHIHLKKCANLDVLNGQFSVLAHIPIVIIRTKSQIEQGKKHTSGGAMHSPYMTIRIP